MFVKKIKNYDHLIYFLWSCRTKVVSKRNENHKTVTKTYFFEYRCDANNCYVTLKCGAYNNIMCIGIRISSYTQTFFFKTTIID